MPKGYTTRPTSQYSTNEEKMLKMIILHIKYLNQTRAFIEAFGIREDPRYADKDDAYWYKTASRVVKTEKYQAMKKEYLESISESKEDIRAYARDVMKRIVQRTEEEQADTAIKAVALLAKVSGIDTEDKAKDANITINFTNAKQEN